MKRRRYKPKTKNTLKGHALGSLHSRYFRDFDPLRPIDTSKLYDTLVSMIAKGNNPNVKLLKRESNTINHYCITYDGVKYFCVYDRARKGITTFLTPTMVQDEVYDFSPFPILNGV